MGCPRCGQHVLAALFRVRQGSSSWQKRTRYIDLLTQRKHPCAPLDDMNAYGYTTGVDYIAAKDFEKSD